MFRILRISYLNRVKAFVDATYFPNKLVNNIFSLLSERKIRPYFQILLAFVSLSVTV
jgi:hypothetical protein